MNRIGVSASEAAETLRVAGASAVGGHGRPRFVLDWCPNGGRRRAGILTDGCKLPLVAFEAPEMITW
jgi:hypothetical protein